MIAKRVPSPKSNSESNAGGLIRYIVDHKNDCEKAEIITITNCESDHYEWAIREIEATQDMNTRSKSNKTYHLVVSFREDEKLNEKITPEMINEIEAEIVKDIGYEDHQRVSAVHNDTDNLHIHIAINKIHPQKLTIHEPYYDKYQLSQSCENLEIKHQLGVDNHAKQGTTRNSRCVETEEIKKDGMTPYNEWVRDRVNIDGISEWEQLHKELANVGAEIIKKGNGYVIRDVDSGIATKCSSVSRDLSKKNIEKKLGSFVEKKKKYKTIEKYNAIKTLVARVPKSQKYYDDFVALKEQNNVNKKRQLKVIKDETDSAIKEIKKLNKKQRDDVKLGNSIKSYKNKRKAYQLISQQRKQAIEKIYATAKEKRAEVHKNNKNISWRDYLINKVLSGDEEALSVLRKLKPQNDKQKNALEGENNNIIIKDDRLSHVTDSGNLVYDQGKAKVVDAGDKVFLSENMDDESLKFAVKLAQAKFGNVEINGTDEFKNKVAEILTDSSNTKKQSKKTIQSFIEGRNKQRKKVTDIKEHELVEKPNGNYVFNGLRTVGDNKVLLIDTKTKTLVMKISNDDFKHLKKQKRGTKIKFNNGKIERGIKI